MRILNFKNNIIVKIIPAPTIIIIIITTYLTIQNVSFINNLIFPQRIISQNFEKDKWLTVLSKHELNLKDYRYNFTKNLKLTNYASNSFNTMYVRIVDENDNIIEDVMEIEDGKDINIK